MYMSVCLYVPYLYVGWYCTYLLIQRMSNFVYGAADALQPEIAGVSGSDAHIGGVRPTSERMHGHIEAPPIE